MTESQAQRTPWHLWVVGIVGVLWNAYGAFDYYMTKTGGVDYMREVGMTDAQISYMGAYPAWMTIVWAIGVWGAVTGAVLLLLRSKWSLWVFIASMVAYVISLIYAYVLAPMPDSSSMIMIMQAVILAGCVFFVWYAFTASKAGHLR